MNEAHSANLEAFGGLSHAALVDIAVALTTYRREKEYVDATFVPTVCGRGDAPLDWAALLVQVSGKVGAYFSRKGWRLQR